MVNPLISALLGAGEQYMADEDASDELKGDIIDGVSKKYFDVELPAQKNTINAMKEVKSVIARQYGDKIADIGDSYGFYEDGSIEKAKERILDFIATTRDTPDTFRSKVEKMSDQDFASAFGKTSMIGVREASLEDRETRVNNIFSDRSNVRDLLVSPDAPQGGIRGFLFGDRLQKKDAITARGKLETAIEDRPQTDIERPDSKSLFKVKTVKDELSTDFLFSPATTYIGSTDEIAKAAATFRGFDQSIQTGEDAFGNTVVTGMNFAGNKELEYNAFVSKMSELAPQFRDPTNNKIDLTALAAAANDALTRQTEVALGDKDAGIFVNYFEMSNQEKKEAGLTGLDLASIAYKSGGFSDTFNETYQTDDAKIKAIIDYIGDLGDKREQRFFADRLPVGVKIMFKGQEEDLRTLIKSIIR